MVNNRIKTARYNWQFPPQVQQNQLWDIGRL